MSPRRSSGSLLFYAASASGSRDAALRPPTDVYSTRKGWLIKMELAGVRLDDVAIDVRGNLLEIHGSRRDTTCDEITGHHNMEIAYQRFSRTVELPEHVHAARISVEFKDGMLLVRVQRNEESE
ncbi:MAG: Hsp20/alpha crystallin family protein [Bryobacterales bacterium]|nr:Hsp20/alpha crystallin family protein [Bryobacterales bacterium]